MRCPAVAAGTHNSSAVSAWPRTLIASSWYCVARSVTDWALELMGGPEKSGPGWPLVQAIYSCLGLMSVTGFTGREKFLACGRRVRFSETGRAVRRRADVAGMVRPAPVRRVRQPGGRFRGLRSAALSGHDMHPDRGHLGQKRDTRFRVFDIMGSLPEHLSNYVHRADFRFPARS